MAELNPVPQRSRQARHRKKPKRARWGTIVAGVLSALVIAIGVLLWLGWAKLNDTYDKIYVPSGDTVTDFVYAPPPQGDAGVNVRNILILGTDNRPRLGSLNTDVIMLVSLRPDTKSAVIASMPRDTYIKPSGWKEGKANGFYAKARGIDKNNAYDMVREIFSEFFEVPIDYVIEVDFKAFEDIVEAFGGVTVDVDIDMRYVDPTDGTNINLRKGVQLLNGKQALDFIRYRQSNNGTRESSDFERNARQQQVISALIGKMKSLDAVLRVGEVLEAVGANIRTTIPRDDTLKMIQTYVGIGDENIQFLRLEGTWRSPYVWANPDSLAEIRDTLKEHNDNRSVAP